MVTDWVLINDNGHTIEKEVPADEECAANGKQKQVFKQAPLLNTLRIPGARKINECVTVTNISCVNPGAMIQSTGRTSGHQTGQICLIPAYLDADKDRKTTKATREWYIQQPHGATDREELWVEGGIGVPGDSGAAVVDSQDDSLYGQIWGRSKYWGPGPRFAYFTTMSDILDDIKEKCSRLKGPLGLPQSSTQERCIVSELRCPACAHPESNPSTPKSGDFDSDKMSVISAFSADELNQEANDAEEVTAREPNRDLPRLETSGTTLSDQDEIMSIDSESAEPSFSPIDDREFGYLIGLIPSASSQNEVDLEMSLEQFQYYDNEGEDFGTNDEALSIDEDGNEEYEMDFSGRSCAHKKKPRLGTSRERLLNSWVMVPAKPRAANTPSETSGEVSEKSRRRRIEKMLTSSKFTTRTGKRSDSLLNSLFKATEVSRCFTV